MIVLDASIMNVALPSIQRGLQFSQADLQWVINIYVLMFGGFLLLGGRAGDLFGRKRMFIIGLILFSLASFGGGLAQSAVGLVLLTQIRVLGSFQHDVLAGMLIVAFGLGMTFVPLQIASVTDVPASEIGLASGLVNAFLQVGGAIGLALLSTISTTEFNGVVHTLHTRLAYPTALVDGFQRAFLAGALLLAAGALVVLLFMPQGGHTEREGTAEATEESVPVFA